MPGFTVNYREPKRLPEEINAQAITLSTPGWAVFDTASDEKIMIPSDLIDSIEQHEEN